MLFRSMLSAICTYFTFKLFLFVCRWMHPWYNFCLNKQGEKWPLFYSIQGLYPYSKSWPWPSACLRYLAISHSSRTTCILGNASRDAIQRVNGLVFRTGSIANVSWHSFPFNFKLQVIYVASGSSCDSFYGLYNTVYAYAPEVRGNSFQPPATNINPSNAELWAGMIAGVTSLVLQFCLKIILFSINRFSVPSSLRRTRMPPSTTQLYNWTVISS